MEILGYICATLVGISLGILGSGGSILTVPIMVYLMNVNPVEATGYSLFVVGISSAIGGIKYVRKNLVDVKTALVFAVPSIVCVFITRIFLMPAIPNPVFASETFIVSKELFIMLLFALLMMVVAYNMIRNGNYKEPDEKEFQPMNYMWLVCIGFISGLLTGIVGVGGGFIIIPALVLLANVPVRMSVGTSLLIITFNSLSGFVGEVIEQHEKIDYQFLLLFSALAVAGIFIGFRAALKKSPSQIRKMFGWFVLVMGIGIFIKEVFIR
ncbi:MAG TPA: sulfite exporter TauE/SafE family protein [Bacteroidia bacterium]|nr:sulfite exporter TauE/SafE family protein [Bacteroidia bacterium]